MPEYIKQVLIELKGVIDNNTITTYKDHLRVYIQTMDYMKKNFKSPPVRALCVAKRNENMAEQKLVHKPLL